MRFYILLLCLLASWAHPMENNPYNQTLAQLNSPAYFQVAHQFEPHEHTIIYLSFVCTKCTNQIVEISFERLQNTVSEHMANEHQTKISSKKINYQEITCDMPGFILRRFIFCRVCNTKIIGELYNKKQFIKRVFTHCKKLHNINIDSKIKFTLYLENAGLEVTSCPKCKKMNQRYQN